MRIALFYLLALCLTSPAWAGAWTLPEGESKATVQYGERRQNLLFLLAPQRDYRLRETFISLLVEHGLSPHVTLSGKWSQQRTREALRLSETQASRLAGQVAAPKLATGLLPPFVFQGLGSLFPHARWHRERKASVLAGLDWQDGHRGQGGYHLGLSLADKVSAGLLSIVQEMEYRETRLSREHHINGQYRFSLQRGNWQLGSQAEQFENQTTGYLSLKHSTRLTWKPPSLPYEITLGRGHTRVNNRQQPLARFQRGQQWTLEFQQKF
jgi:hypothetical protein